MIPAHRIPAEKLKREFGVYGHFYDIVFEGAQFGCRSVLEIASHDVTPLQLSDLSSRTPDVVVVMMNPGSSHPLDPAYRPWVLSSTAAIPESIEMVPAQPDVTQYQVMRLLSVQSLQHARIVNLSDLREPKSGQFLSRIQGFMGSSIPHWHSLFSQDRAAECHAKLGPKKIPAIVGWGQDTGLRDLALLALDRLQGRRVVGVPAANGGGVFFRHPSPMLQKAKDAWLTDIAGLLKQI